MHANPLPKFAKKKKPCSISIMTWKLKAAGCVVALALPSVSSPGPARPADPFSVLFNR
jgi:hypothetical protein